MLTKNGLKQLFDIFKYPVFLFWTNILIDPLYEFLPEIDIFMHLLGGFVILISLFYFFKYTNQLSKIKKLPTAQQLAILIGLIILIGVLWEIYEIIIDLFWGIIWYAGPVDTMIDLVMDIIGAWIGFRIFWKK